MAFDSPSPVLAIDDDRDVAELVCDVARRLGHAATATTDAASFLARATEGVRVAFVDLRLPDATGVDLLTSLARLPAPPEVVLMSGVDAPMLLTMERLARSLGLVVRGTLEKPFALERVRALLGSTAPRVKRARSVPPPSDDALAEAVDTGAFEVWFQPQVELASGRVSGLEALVRFRHPVHGEMPTDRFLHAVTRVGRMPALTDRVIDRSLSLVARLRRRDLALTVSVNVPVSVLARRGLAEAVLARLADAALPPSTLCIEITESELVDDDGDILVTLLRLRLAGVGISIDDFGTGHSTLEQARRIPATELKVDREFVLGMLDSSRAATIVRHVLALGRDLGMRVVAEGVETDELARALLAMGCTTAQGFLYARALPVDALEAFLAEQETRVVRRSA